MWSEFNLRYEITDECFGAAINAVMRKYMSGQAALTVDVANRSWLPKTQAIDHDDKIPERLLRILRVCAAPKKFRLSVAWTLSEKELSMSRQRRAAQEKVVVKTA